MLIKTAKDYYQQMYEMFPEVPKRDIQKIINLGWKTLYLYNSCGADTIIKDNSFWCYIGFLKKNPLQYFEYYIKKLRTKLRILYKRKSINWDGYYYFALNDSQYEYYLCQQSKRGRKKQKFRFEKLFLYQILDECKIAENHCRYIFRIPYTCRVNYRFYLPELVTSKAELILTREPLKFKDVLINDNKYDLL